MSTGFQGFGFQGLRVLGGSRDLVFGSCEASEEFVFFGFRDSGSQGVRVFPKVKIFKAIPGTTDLAARSSYKQLI